MSLFYKHSVYNQAVANFVYSVSSRAMSNLISSPSLSDAHNCRPYSIVVKRNKKYFWNHVKLFPTPFTLSDILDADDFGGEFAKMDPTERDLVTFERSLKIEAKGKLGVSLALEIAGFELDADHHIEVSVDFGQIVEKSLDIPDLVKSVNGRKVNLKNSFIREVMEKKRNTLCLVVTSLDTVDESKITTEIQTSGKAEGNVTTGSANMVTVDAALSGDRKRSIEIPSNTPLAFRMLEILVRSDRTIQLMQLPDSEGGFMAIEEDSKEAIRDLTPRGDLQSDTSGPVHDLEEIRDQLKPLLTLDRDALFAVRRVLVHLLKRPILLDSLNIVFQVAFNSLLVGGGGKETTQEMLKEKLSCPDLDDITPLLRMAGFTFQENNVTFPTADESHILICISSLLDLMDSLNEDQTKILDESSEEERTSIIKVLSDTLVAERLPLDESIVSELFAGSRRAECLVFSLGFQLERTRGQWYLSYRKGETLFGGTDQDDLNPAGLLVILTALWD